MGATQTIKVRGEGGAIQTMDVPPAGTHRREQLDGFIRRGWLTVIEGDYTPADTSPEPDDDASDGDKPPEPPRSGKGSGVAAWRAYADAIGVEYDADASASDIIAAVDASRADD